MHSIDLFLEDCGGKHLRLRQNLDERDLIRRRLETVEDEQHVGVELRHHPLDVGARSDLELAVRVLHRRNEDLGGDALEARVRVELIVEDLGVDVEFQFHGPASGSHRIGPEENKVGIRVI